MSDSTKQSKDELHQDLEQLLSNSSTQGSKLTEEEDSIKGDKALDESDLSLSSIHTGSGSEYENSQAKENKTETTAENNSTIASVVDENSIEENSTAEFRSSEESLPSTPIEVSALLSEVQESVQVDAEGIDPSISPLLAGTDDIETLHSNREQAEDNTNPVVTSNDGQEVELNNAAPESVALDTNSIDEGASIGDVVGTVSATDPESDTLSYSLSDDAGGMFTIDASSG
ncbi:hypothetical protein A9Q83_01480, partial [Alphaproteobacteria bacterium 46_93_T64]